MKAAVYRGIGDIEISEREVPVPGPGEVLVRVAACGICGSDATEYGRGPQLIAVRPDGGVDPVVLGHEFAGTVDAVGEGVAALAAGAIVVSGAGISCGTCVMCRAGRTNVCRSYSTVGFHRDGGLAGYAVVPAETLIDVTASGLPLDTLALAQPLAVAVHAVRRSGLTAGQDAVIVGAGGIGTFIGFVAASTGARVLVVDLNDERLALATDLGAFAVANARDGELRDLVARAGLDPQVFFEVSGSVAGLESILATALPGAVIVPVGIQKQPFPAPLGSWTLREYTIVGTVAHVIADDLPEAVRLLGTRGDWSDIAGTVIPLEALIADGLEPLGNGKTTQIKTLVDPWADAPRPASHRAQSHEDASRGRQSGETMGEVE
jgi:(R,R)-butanediol dehydrogenase/meso-butanediol dehydrogenase/diacetyl reductase